MHRAMVYEYNCDIPMRDSSVLRANVYRPVHVRACPVIMSMGPYAKDRHLADRAPELARALGGGPFANWETPDPDWWVANDYVLVRVDSRGSGQSPGFLAPFSAQIARDYHDAIEWAGVQPWSTGKVGTLGVSYYGSSQWAAAALKPPHLAAMIPWEGFADAYRDLYRHGGILNNRFVEWWWPQSILNVQYGKGELPESELQANQLDVIGTLRERPMVDPFYTDWVGDPAAIEVPFLSVGNQPMHTHDEVQRLVPGEPVALDIEIWPTSIVFERGSRLVLELRGCDFEKGGPLGHGAADPNVKPTPFIHFLHDDPVDRPADRFGGTHTVHTGGRYDSRLLLPIIPAAGRH